ncbi:MAG TPA: DUF2288 family protein [Gammaproteobacteria bacterium]
MLPLDEELKARLNGETGKLGWPELQRHFARGVVVVAAAGMDLVEVATRMSMDDGETVNQWLAAEQIRRASEADARRWVESDAQFWAVVVAPWVVVQEIPLQLAS